MANIEIEKIMDEIREQAKAKGDTTLPGFDETAQAIWETNGFNKVKYNENMYDINQTWNVQPELPIGGRGGFVGKIITVFKKLARKCMRFYVMPIVIAQNSFNARVVTNLNMLSTYLEEHTVDEHTVHYSDLQYTVKSVLAKDVQALKAENAQLKEELAALSARVASLDHH
ncbi:MAG: hypothetical protein RSC73_01660 [Ruthenibacterium sp.]